MSDDLWGDIQSTRDLLRKALSLSKQRGGDAAHAKADYYTVKSQVMFALKEQGYPVTFIDGVIKGIPEVNEKLLAHEIAEVEYENAKEARNVYKKELDTLREQYEREWGECNAKHSPY